ncbi:MAG: tetratricopeptide repeat protein [Saprospiraceae bacterium]
MADRLEQLKTFLRENPEDPFILFAIAKEYEKQGIPEKALEFYSRVIEADPNYVGVYYHLGKWHEKAGAFDQAIEVYKKGQEVAKAQGDKHALGELNAALLNLE